MPATRPSLDGLLEPSAEVAEALSASRPVTALETTVVAHAFSPPEGLELALEAERRVRAVGAVPATIGLADGRVRLGMDERTLERFAEGTSVRKLAARDLAACLAQRALGAVTVGATLAICRLAGIATASTGGLGGVHRNAAETFDVSGDVAELTRTRAVVVASGVKSILDVPATMELLETLGVPALGWRTDRLPLYYQASGGPRLRTQVEDAAEVAAIAATHWALDRPGALLLARPPTLEVEVAPLVDAGLTEARREGVSGHEVTPFLLAYLDEHSNGRTVEPHKRIVLDNAELAAEVAVELARLG